jgi:hypothetical protein
MSDTIIQKQSIGYKIGWWILIGFNVWSVIGHAVFIFIYPAVSLFRIWTAFHLIAVVILLIPYRRGEKWAWYLVWIIILPMALVIINEQSFIGSSYLVAAGLMAIGQLLTRPAFFTTGSAQSL